MKSMCEMSSLAWLWILLCASYFLSSSADLENPQMLRNRDFLIKELSPSDPDQHGTSTGGKLKLDTDSDRRELMDSENITLTDKAQRGRGSYGGANVVHKRPGQKSDALFYGPCCFISSASLAFSFSLLLAFSF